MKTLSIQTKTDSRRDFALQVVKKLRQSGFTALWAGGCVRDLLLGKAPKDYDVATDAKPGQVRKLFPRSLAIGASFGVIQVLGPKGSDVEVATFRQDGEYRDGRHPSSVVYSSPREDARRRDFTINGMFFDPIEETVLDYVGGKDDLAAGVVRAIGDPRQRFHEDKLRMLRAVRFAALFEFQLDPPTEAAVCEMADQLAIVSAERILVEFKRMLVAPQRFVAVEMMLRTGLLKQVASDIHDALMEARTQEKIRRILTYWTKEATFPLALSGLLCALPQSQGANAAEELLRRLKASNEDRQRTVFLAANSQALRNASTRTMAHLKRVFADPGCDELIDLTEAIEVAETDQAAGADFCRQKRAEWGIDEISPPPLITGEDLIANGLKPGPRFKPLLESIRDAQLDCEIKTRQEALELAAKLEPGLAAKGTLRSGAK